MTVVFDDEKQNTTLAELRKDEEEELVKLLSDKYNLPYLRDTIMDHGCLVDVAETGARWADVLPLYREAIRALSEKFKRDEVPGFYLGCHISHTGGRQVFDEHRRRAHGYDRPSDVRDQHRHHRADVHVGQARCRHSHNCSPAGSIAITSTVWRRAPLRCRARHNADNAPSSALARR